MDLNKNLLHFLSNSQGWSSLNTIQKKAIPHVLNGEDTLILSPTASGKSEAAFIPIFSDILDNNLEAVSVLYISPLKALINDMHNRILKWCNHFGLTTTKWHGDVERNIKNNFIKNPSDFLSITPESLEVIIMNKKKSEKEKIFKNVKYIIIDEIHYFANSDRGIQLNSLINRIKKYAPNVSIIGLSATVGNPKEIAEWINTKKAATIVEDTYGRKLQYKVKNLDENNLYKVLNKYKNKKVLIFANSRRVAESSYYHLKKKMDMKNIFIHHGSVNKNMREENEAKFKNLQNAFMISTNTLELGIDIGDIDVVVQISPPSNVSSFSQRIGRSGRQSKVQRTILLARGFNILLSLSEVMLYHERSVEKIHISKKSTDIFIHQILSSLFEKGTMHYKDLYKYLKNCYAFSEITPKEYVKIMKNMASEELVNISGTKISLGYEFEKEFGQGNFKDFYAVFTPSFSYKILEGIKEVGTLDETYAIDLNVNDQFNLAGQLWRVKSINHDDYKVYVTKENLTSSKLPSWYSEGAPIDFLICEKIYEILQGDFERKFLKPFDKDSQNLIEKAIESAKKDEFREGILPIELNKNTIYIYTFAGDKANKLLLKVFEMYYDVYNPYTTSLYISFKVSGGITEEEIEEIIYNLENILNNSESEDMLDDLTESFKKNKFLQYLPKDIRKNVKMDIIFDKESLLKATHDKSINFISESAFRKTIFTKDFE